MNWWPNNDTNNIGYKSASSHASQGKIDHFFASGMHSTNQIEFLPIDDVGVLNTERKLFIQNFVNFVLFCTQQNEKSPKTKTQMNKIYI